MSFPKIGAEVRNRGAARAIDAQTVDGVCIVAWTSLGLSIVFFQLLAPLCQPLVSDVIGALLRH